MKKTKQVKREGQKFAWSFVIVCFLLSGAVLLNMSTSKKTILNKNNSNINVSSYLSGEKIGLGEDFFSDNNFIYKKYPGSNGFRFVKIDKADPNTFKILDKTFSKDANFVFFTTSILNGADPYSFETIDNGYINDADIYQYYAKDKNNVYAFRRYTGDKWIIDQADPNTFILLDKYIYQKDKNYAYYEGKKLESSDAGSFEFIKKPNSAIITKDTNLLKMPYPHIAKDANNIWFYNKLIKTNNIDIDSFEIMDCWYQKDKNNVYIYNEGPGSMDFGKKITNADPATFKFLDCHYAKDKNYVYYEGKIIPNADPNTITFIITDYTKKTGPMTDQIFDKKNLAISEKVTEFEYDKINRLFNYTKDKNSVYDRGEIIPSANPDTFKIK